MLTDKDRHKVWARHEASMEEMRNGSMPRRDHMRDLGADWKVYIKMDLHTIGFSGWRFLIGHILVSTKGGKYLDQ
jgi:hypothetical protein